MMKSKLFLGNLVRPVLLFSFLLYNLAGCQSHQIEPTYKEENLTALVKQICKDEYSLDVVTGRTPTTLWVYAPLQKILHKDYGKKEDKFFDEEIIENLRHILTTIGRVLVSSDRTPEFFVLVASDINIGIDYALIANVLDIKKTYAGFLPFTETQKRYVIKLNLAPEAVGDTTGRHVLISDIKLADFLAQQIAQRITGLFQTGELKKYFKIEKSNGTFDNGRFVFAYSIQQTAKPERQINVMKEILNTATFCIRTYEFRDFSALEVNDVVTQDKLVLNQQEVWARPLPVN